MASLLFNRRQRPAPEGLKAILAVVFMPFACGYFLSYLYRSVNAVVAPDLIAEIGLNAAQLGFLTSIYFLTFASAQIPLGILLDRFGPRRIQSVLLLFAATGAYLFSQADSEAGLVLGRGLIGLGVSGCLMASFKALVQWFPRDRLALANGAFMAFGGLGALAATSPVEFATGLVGWRGVFISLSFATLVAAALIFIIVPDKQEDTAPGSLADVLKGLKVILADRLFWHLMPATALTVGVSMSTQGLWAGPWLRDVAGYDRLTVANHLLFMAGALTLCFLGAGVIADRLSKRGIATYDVIGVGMMLFLVVQVPLALGLTEGTWLLWIAFGLLGNTGSMIYAVISQHFPAAYAARSNTMQNLAVFLASFTVQFAIGAIINLYPSTAEGNYNPEGFSAAFTVMLSLQVVAVIWFYAGRKHALK